MLPEKLGKEPTYEEILRGWRTQERLVEGRGRGVKTTQGEVTGVLVPFFNGWLAPNFHFQISDNTNVSESRILEM